MASDDLSPSGGYPTPHDNTCDECGHEWRSRGTPAACPECGSDMPEHGTCIDLFDRARGTDVTPVGEDAIADLEREADRRTQLGDGPAPEPLADAYDGVGAAYKERRSYQRGDGRRDDRGRYWQVQRERAIERDRRRCQSCGVTRAHYQEVRGYDLDVHHIVPEREFDSAIDAHALENLITLCKTCHEECEGMVRKELIHRTDHHDWVDSADE